MLSKFNLAKPAKFCVDAVRPYEREHPTNIISVPLLEHYDRATQADENSNDDAVSLIHESASRDLRIERAIETMK